YTTSSLYSTMDINQIMLRMCSTQHDLGMPVNIHADIGHGKMTRTALNQTYTQTLFQIKHPAAEFGFGNIGRTFGCTKAAMFHHLSETVKVIQIRQHGLIPFLQR